MTIEKLPSGKYRITQMYKGKRYRMLFDTKPSEREATLALADLINTKAPDGSKKKFKTACEEYVKAKEHVLSPRTVREYKRYPNRLPEWFCDFQVSNITQNEVQICINELAADKKPKTVRDIHGFISGVLKMYKPELKLKTTLPKKLKEEPYIPTKEEVKKILEYTKENDPMFYVPIYLATYGLRRSEILALTLKDIDKDNVVHINKALVENDNNEWIIKTTKTTESTRTVPINKELANYIRQQGYVYKGGAQSISNYLARVEKELNIKPFSLHKLRHYFASQLLSVGVPMEDVQALGGWNGDTTLKEVYAHAMKSRTIEERRALIANALE